jgi:predicted RNase H-like HicB family nuclease
MTLTAIIEKTSNGYSGYTAELGAQVIAAGETIEEVSELLRESAKTILQDLRLEGKPNPEPQTLVRFLEIA